MTKIKYKRNFLTKVIFRIDFNSISLSQLKDFKDYIKKDFPNIQEEKGEEGTIDFDLKTKKIKQVSNNLSIWVFSNKTKTKKIKIQSRFLFIEYTKYKDSTELLKDIQHIKKFVEMFKINTINKMGLRYVNEIENIKNFTNWHDYIVDELVGALKFTKTKEIKIARAMNLIVTKNDFCDISFNHGIWNNNYPNEINKQSYILDFDGRSKYPIGIDNNFDLVSLVKNYNNEIERIFELVIKEKFRKILKN